MPLTDEQRRRLPTWATKYIDDLESDYEVEVTRNEQLIGTFVERTGETDVIARTSRLGDFPMPPDCRVEFRRSDGSAFEVRLREDQLDIRDRDGHVLAIHPKAANHVDVGVVAFP